MRIVVCAKQVLDPDGVNSYALWGRLSVDASGRKFQAGGDIPQILNAYDEQATEAALRIRDDGVETEITALASGDESANTVLRRCVAMGIENAVQVIDPQVGLADGFRTARILAAAIKEIGNVDLVLCGRQGSDYDQGSVPAVLAELLNAAYVTMARDVRADGGGVRVTRVTPDGDEVVHASLPAVVSVSNELGQPRYPSSRGMMQARRNPPTVRQADQLLGGANGHAIELVQLFVPNVQGHCEIIEGDSAAAKVETLVRRLKETGAFSG